MKLENVKKELMDTEHICDKLGETIYDMIQGEDNSTYEMGKSVYDVFARLCTTEEQKIVANRMLIAICGWSIETVLKKIQERDENGYTWESVWD